MMPALKSVRQSSVPSGGEICQAFIDDDSSRQVVSEVLGEQSGISAAIETGGVAAALRQLKPDSSPRLLIVDIAEGDDAASDIAALMSVADPSTRVIAIGGVNDISLFRDLLAVGVADYVVKPIDRRVLALAVMGALRAGRPAEQTQKLGKVGVFFGTRGGIGATTAAVNTAWLIGQEQKKRTALVDLDLHFGTIALNLAFDPGSGLREALERPERIDDLFIDRAMHKQSDSFYILSAEESLVDTLLFDPASLRVLLSALQQKFDVVLIDLPRGMTPLQRHVLSAADHLIVVSELSLPGIRDACRIKRFLSDTASLAKLSFVAGGSPAPKGARVSDADFEKTVGQKLAFSLPFDQKAAAAAAATGKPIVAAARAAEVTKMYRRIAVEIAGEPAGNGSVPFWKRFRR
jgi:pilus assembly protein CpaE